MSVDQSERPSVLKSWRNSAVTVAKLMAAKTEKAVLSKIWLPAVHRALGKDCFEHQRNLDPAESLVQLLQKTTEIGATHNNGAPTSSSGRLPAVKFLSLINRIAIKARQIQNCMRRTIVFGELGKAIYQKYGAESGPENLVQPIRDAERRLAAIKERITTLSAATSGMSIAATAMLVIAPIVLLSGFVWKTGATPSHDDFDRIDGVTFPKTIESTAAELAFDGLVLGMPLDVFKKNHTDAKSDGRSDYFRYIAHDDRISSLKSSEYAVVEAHFFDERLYKMSLEYWTLSGDSNHANKRELLKALIDHFGPYEAPQDEPKRLYWEIPGASVVLKFEARESRLEAWDFDIEQRSNRRDEGRERTPDQLRAATSFQFEEVGISMPIEEFKKLHPEAEVVDDMTNKSLETEGFTIRPKSASECLVRFLEGRLCEIRVLYDKAKVESVGGIGFLAQKIDGKFGQADSKPHQDLIGPGFTSVWRWGLEEVNKSFTLKLKADGTVILFIEDLAQVRRLTAIDKTLNEVNKVGF